MYVKLHGLLESALTGTREHVKITCTEIRQSAGELIRDKENYYDLACGKDNSVELLSTPRSEVPMIL